MQLKDIAGPEQATTTLATEKPLSLLLPPPAPIPITTRKLFFGINEND